MFLSRVQHWLRGINEQLYQACCERIEEGAGVKLSGQTEAWKTHLDINRLGTYQNIIALTDTVAAVCPKSHTLTWPTTGDFYELTPDDINNLACRNMALKEIKMGAGDVLIMIGGRVAHDIPGVPAAYGHRYTTYATKGTNASNRQFFIGTLRPPSRMLSTLPQPTSKKIN